MKLSAVIICIVCTSCVGVPNRSLAVDGTITTAGRTTVKYLCSRLHLQEGGIMGYPYSDNNVVYREPARSIVKASNDQMKEVISELKSRLSDYTICDRCGESGRLGMGTKYTVSDVACFILVEIHTLESLELVFLELRRRREERRDWKAIRTAIQSHHHGRSYRMRMREELNPNKEGDLRSP